MINLLFKRQLNIVLVFFLVVNTCFYPLANGNNNSTYDTETTTFFDSANDKKENYESDENTESIVETESLTIEFNELVDTESIDESFDVSNIGDEENDLPNSNSAESENDRETERYSEKEAISNNENVESSKNDEKDKGLVETEEKIEAEKDEETIETDKTTTEIALETSEEKKENNIKETETYETTESAKESIEETEDVPEVVDEISTISQIKNIDDDLNISSMSEIDDKIGEELKNDLSYTTLDLLDNNIWTITDSDMTLKQNITLNKPILIDRDVNIDFSNYTIDTTIDDYVFIVIDSTVYFSDGIIKGRNGDVDKPDGSDAISLINSNLTINNCNIYGGNGYSIQDRDETVGDGGSAIIARYENNDKKIIFNSGEIVGGTGGTGNVNGVQGIGGLAISGKGVSSKKRINGNIFDVENGSNGDIGCGNGGNAIMMFGENLSLDNILINSSGIHGGNAGLEIKNTKRKLLKKNKLGADLPTKYNSVENGWTTSLKNQKNTNMCSTFSFCSVAETQLIKNYPDKLQKMGYEEITDIDLSEYAEHFYIFTPPVVYPDYFNSTSYIREDAGISRYTSGTITNKEVVTDQPLYLIDHATLNSKRLGLTTENKAPLFTGNSNTINKTDLYTMSGKDENPLALKNRVAVLKSAEMLNSNVKYPKEQSGMDEYRKNMLPYINDLKSRIINNGSILLGLDPGFQATQMEYEGKTIRVLSKVSSGGHVGHCVALVGFDDTFQNGAFIAKDSNSSEYYTYIPYDMENGNWEAMDCEFELNPTNEIVFSNDQGVAYETNYWMGYDLKNGYGVKHKIEEVIGGDEVEIEKLKAVTVMLPSNIQNLTVRIVEVEKNDKMNGTPDIKEIIAEKEINAKVGLNYIDFTDVENRNLSVGKSYLVSVYKNNKFDIFIDCDDEEGKTIISPNNYVYDEDGWKRINASNTDAMNPRIKLLTGIAKKATFDANGGKYEDETTVYEDYFANGEKIKGLKIPTRQGYEFIGYGESNTATEKTIDEGVEWTYTENKIFYAIWKAIEYKAVFDANGGEYADGTTSYEKQYTVESDIDVIDLKIPIREGHVFVGYGVGQDDTSVAITEGQKWNFTENKLFYAIWRLEGEEIIYTATFNANGGKYADNTTSYQKQYTVESDINVSDLVTPTKQGYEFIGYGESDTATEPITLAGQKWSYTENKTFYAVWRAINYTATFNANGGKFIDNTTSYEKQYTVESNINASDLVEPVREGYEFIGYGESDTATEPLTLAGQQWSYAENKTFYAVWKAINYTATFNANGGMFGNQPSINKNYTIEDDIVELENPTRNGYEFLGYSESGTEPATIVSGGKWTYTENKTFNAIWRAISYTATFNANGGKHADGTTNYEKQYTIESIINANDLLTPIRDGYEFIGYGDSEAATEKIIDVGEEWSYTENKTFYAVWKEIQQETSETNPSETQPSETETSETETTVAPTTTKASNSNNNRGGGNSGGSGGSRGGSISIANAENAMLPTTTAKQTTVEEKPIGATVMQPIDDSNSVKMTQNSVDVITTKVAWNYNDAIKKWNMIFENETSKSIEFAVNGFFKVNDNTNVDSSHLNEYVFDAYGNMITGFVSDKTGKWYFFDDVENDNIGRKVVGWRKYGENWYYFSKEGVMYQDAITPDGYYVNPNGVWTNQEKVSTNTTITTTNINPAQTSTTPASNTAAVSPAQTSTTPTSNTIVVSPSNSANVSVANTGTNKTAKSTSGSFGPGVMIDNAKNNAAKVIGLSNTTK